MARELVELTSPSEVAEAAFMAGFAPAMDSLRSDGVPDEKINQVKAAAMRLAKRVSGDPELVSMLADIHVAEFSEAELKEILAFYRTPAGKKAMEKMPELMQQGAVVGQQITNKYIADFQAEIMGILQAP